MKLSLKVERHRLALQQIWYIIAWCHWSSTSITGNDRQLPAYKKAPDRQRSRTSILLHFLLYSASPGVETSQSTLSLHSPCSMARARLKSVIPWPSSHTQPPWPQQGVEAGVGHRGMQMLRDLSWASAVGCMESMSNAVFSRHMSDVSLLFIYIYIYAYMCESNIIMCIYIYMIIYVYIQSFKGKY